MRHDRATVVAYAKKIIEEYRSDRARGKEGSGEAHEAGGSRTSTPCQHCGNAFTYEDGECAKCGEPNTDSRTSRSASSRRASWHPQRQETTTATSSGFAPRAGGPWSVQNKTDSTRAHQTTDDRLRYSPHHREHAPQSRRFGGHSTPHDSLTPLPHSRQEKSASRVTGRGTRVTSLGVCRKQLCIPDFEYGRLPLLENKGCMKGGSECVGRREREFLLGPLENKLENARLDIRSRSHVWSVFVLFSHWDT
jgi:ribosomal protein L37E